MALLATRQRSKLATFAGEIDVAKSKKILPVKTRCEECGGRETKHHVLFQKLTEKTFDNGESSNINMYQVVECAGCETVRFRHAVESYDSKDNDYYNLEIGVYPDEWKMKCRKPGAAKDVLVDNLQKIIPNQVFRMYRESLEAYNANIFTLSAVGLRAIVEAVCLERGIKENNLVKKIDRLVSDKHLTATQGEFLHTIRLFGNEAAHEMARHEAVELESIFEIIEGMLNTIYVLPAKNAEFIKKQKLKKNPPAKTKGKPPT